MKSKMMKTLAGVTLAVGVTCALPAGAIPKIPPVVKQAAAASIINALSQAFMVYLSHRYFPSARPGVGHPIYGRR